MGRVCSELASDNWLAWSAASFKRRISGDSSLGFGARILRVARFRWSPYSLERLSGYACGRFGRNAVRAGIARCANTDCRVRQNQLALLPMQSGSWVQVRMRGPQPAQRIRCCRWKFSAMPQCRTQHRNWIGSYPTPSSRACYLQRPKCASAMRAKAKKRMRDPRT